MKYLKASSINLAELMDSPLTGFLTEPQASITHEQL